MPHTPLHLSTKKHPLSPTTKRRTTAFDKIVLGVSVLYPLSASPQVIAVFSGKTEGVAALSWVGFLCCTILFLIYGLRHKVAPMIIANSLWVVMDILVIIGLFSSGNGVTWI